MSASARIHSHSPRSPWWWVSVPEFTRTVALAPTLSAATLYSDYEGGGKCKHVLESFYEQLSNLRKFDTERDKPSTIYKTHRVSHGLDGWACIGMEGTYREPHGAVTLCPHAVSSCGFWHVATEHLTRGCCEFCYQWWINMRYWKLMMKPHWRYHW